MRSKLTTDIYIISDSTGGLINHTVRTVLTQFPHQSFNYQMFNFIDDPVKISGVFKKFTKINCLVFYAIIDSRLNNKLKKLLDEAKIPGYDVTAGIIKFVSSKLQSKPINSLNAVHKTDDIYFNRMDSLEFTLQHDDSRRLKSSIQADIIILGVSRVSKTPTSILLGSMGYKVANVSLIPSHGLPSEIKNYKFKTVALTSTPDTLYEIRKRRMEKNKFKPVLKKINPYFNYMNIKDIQDEINQAENIYLKERIPIININGLTIEEIAGKILEIVDLIKSPYS